MRNFIRQQVNRLQNTNPMKPLTHITYSPTPSTFKSEREELVARLVDGINKERVGTPYKPTTAKRVALLLNRNPWLAGQRNNGEVRLLIKECEKVGHYKKFWWIINPKKI